MEQDKVFEAIAAGDRNKVEAWLGDDPECADARNSKGVPAVLFALYHGQAGIAELLAARATELDVHVLAALGRTEALARHLKERPGDVSAVSADGFQPVHLAGFFARTGALDVLIGAGADVDVKAGAGMAPIHSAAASRQAAPLRQLLDAGADPNALQPGGFTALMSAAAHGLTEMAEALLEAGADPAIRADDGRCAADFARAGQHGELAQRLEARG